MEKKNQMNTATKTNPTNHFDTPCCPIHEYLAEGLLNIPPCRDNNCGNLKTGTGNDCCAFLMMRFVAYCNDPEDFARKAREVIEKYR